MVSSSSDKIVIPLLGFHRSGTSLAAHAFGRAGIPLGDKLLLDARPDNADGYWEDGDVVAVQEQLLKDRFGSAQDIWGIPSLADADGPALSASSRQRAIDSLRAILADRLAERRVFAFKDPRTTRLLGIWKEIAKSDGFKMLPFLLLRHPGAVAASLETRNRIQPIVGELMWLRAIAEVLREVGDLLAGAIVYERWFDNPAINNRTIAAFASTLGLTAAAPDASPVRPEFRHETSLHCSLPLSGEVYATLARFAGRRPAVTVRRALLARIDGLVQSFGGWLPLANVLSQSETYRRARPVALPFPAPPPAEKVDPSPWPGEPILEFGNRWCLARPGGNYHLHANAPDQPDVALVWRGIRVRPGTRLVMRFTPALAQTPPLSVRVDIRLPENDTIWRRQLFALRFGDDVAPEAELPDETLCDIALCVSVAPPTDNAHCAALFVSPPHLMERNPPGP